MTYGVVRAFQVIVNTLLCSPEKAGVGGSTPSLATIIPKNLSEIWRQETGKITHGGSPTILPSCPYFPVFGSPMATIEVVGNTEAEADKNHPRRSPTWTVTDPPTNLKLGFLDTGAFIGYLALEIADTMWPSGLCRAAVP